MRWRKAWWCLVTAAALAIIATAVLPESLLWWSERQLDGLYAQHRPHAYRWTGAPHASLAQSPTPSEQLAPIRWNIRRAEESRGRNGKSLRLTSRLELLAGHFDQAISALELAHLLDTADGELLSELGAAYASRAAAEKRPADFAPALEALLRGHELAPSSAVAAFNLAIICQEFPLIRQALAHWDRVLELERAPAWWAEASERRKATELALHKRKPISEESFGTSLASPGGAEVMKTRGAAEVAMSTMMRYWLRDPDRWRPALVALARSLEQTHQDQWLNDLLAFPDSPAQRAAWLSLSDAWRYNAADQHERAVRSSSEAVRQFRAAGNLPGELRAVLESVMGLHRQGKSAACLEALSSVRARAQAHSYRWIYGQAWLEEVVCLGQERRHDVVAQREEAYRWVQSSGYTGLELRALGFFIEAQLANPMVVWGRGYPGLLSYRDTMLAPERVHPLYYFLSESARNWDHPRAAAALARESVLNLESSTHRQLHAYMLSRLGSLHARLAQHEEASSVYRQAAQVMAEAGSEGGQALRALAELELAQGDTAGGRPQDAVTRLRGLGELKYGAYGPILMRPTLGAALLAADHVDEAISEFETAIQESDRHRELLRDPFQREAASREIESAVRGMAAARLRQGSPEKALQAWRGYRHRAGGEPGAPRPLERTASLTTAFLGDQLAVWFEDAQGLVHFSCPASPVRREAQRLSKLAADSTSPLAAIGESRALLSAQLLAPLDARLRRVSTLLVDADGDTAAIPWALLSVGDGSRLVDHMGVLLAGRGGRLPTPAVHWDDALILANPELGPDWAPAFPPLDDARRESDFLRARVRHSRVLEGREVTWEAMARHLPQHRLIHFAGHGLSHGGFGALLVSGSRGEARIVSADDIRQLELTGVELVFLATCATGGTGPFDAANMDSLVNAFLTAGASGIVAPRWNAASGATRAVVELFYERLFSGVPAPEALRLAMLHTSRQTGSAHPYYWAGFQIFGSL